MPRGLVTVDGGALRAERERAGLSVDDVTRRTGIALATLRRIEGGPPKPLRPATLRKLARAIGVEPGQLVTGAE